MKYLWKIQHTIMHMQNHTSHAILDGGIYVIMSLIKSQVINKTNSVMHAVLYCSSFQLRNMFRNKSACVRINIDEMFAHYMVSPQK